MTLSLRTALYSLLIVLSSISCRAGFGFSAGPLINYPLLHTGFGSVINAGHLGGGGRLGVDYLSKNSRLFPSICFSAGQHRLPLHSQGTNIGAMNFSFNSLVINGCYNVDLHERCLTLYCGIGLFNLGKTEVSASGAQNSIVAIDSAADISHFFPTADIGIEFKGKASDKTFFLSLGFCLHYIRMPDGRNTYYVRVANGGSSTFNTQANLSGHLFEPTLYVNLNYRPHKKGDSWYLD